MIIAVNARTLRAVPRDGIGWFTLEVVSGMVRNHPEHRFVLIGDRRYGKLTAEGNLQDEQTPAEGNRQHEHAPAADVRASGILPVEGRNVEYMIIPAFNRKNSGCPDICSRNSSG